MREYNAEYKGSYSGSRRRVVSVLVGLTILAVGLPVLVRALGGGEYLRTLVEGGGRVGPGGVCRREGSGYYRGAAPRHAYEGGLGHLFSVGGCRLLGARLYHSGCVCYGISRSLRRGSVARFVVRSDWTDRRAGPLLKRLV